MSGPNAFLICAFRSADFLRWCLSPSTTSRTISFSISNSFWYSFDSFFRFFRRQEKRCRLIVGFAASIPCHAIWQCEEWELFRRVQRFGQRKVWTQRYSRGEKLRCKFLARKSAILIANFSATMVTSLLSLSLSLSLSLCISLSLSLSLSLTKRTSRTI